MTAPHMHSCIDCKPSRPPLHFGDNGRPLGKHRRVGARGDWRWRGRETVTLDGVDVTGVCFEAYEFDGFGFVGVYNEEGGRRHVAHGGHVCRRYVRGRVSIQRKHLSVSERLTLRWLGLRLLVGHPKVT